MGTCDNGSWGFGKKVAKLNVITGFDSIQKGYPFTLCGVETYQDWCLEKIEVSLWKLTTCACNVWLYVSFLGKRCNIKYLSLGEAYISGMD